MWPRQSCQLAGIPVTEDPPVTSCLEFWPVSTIWKGTGETDPFLTEMIGPDTPSFEYIPLVLLSFSSIFYFSIQKRILLWYNFNFFGFSALCMFQNGIRNWQNARMFHSQPKWNGLERNWQLWADFSMICFFVCGYIHCRGMCACLAMHPCVSYRILVLVLHGPWLVILIFDWYHCMKTCRKTFHSRH